MSRRPPDTPLARILAPWTRTHLSPLLRVSRGQLADYVSGRIRLPSALWGRIVALASPDPAQVAAVATWQAGLPRVRAASFSRAFHVAVTDSAKCDG